MRKNIDESLNTDRIYNRVVRQTKMIFTHFLEEIFSPATSTRSLNPILSAVHDFSTNWQKNFNRSAAKFYSNQIDLGGLRFIGFVRLAECYRNYTRKLIEFSRTVGEDRRVSFEISQVSDFTLPLSPPKVQKKCSKVVREKGLFTKNYQQFVNNFHIFTSGDAFLFNLRNEWNENEWQQWLDPL